MNAVEIQDLYWRYPAFVGSENPWALQGVSLQIKQGEFFGITGTSGAGKTTICKFILGLIPYAVKIPMRRVNHHLRGSVSVLGAASTVVDTQANPHPQTGEPLGAITRSGIISPRVGMVFQDPENQFLRMSLLHVVDYRLRIVVG